MGKKGYPHAVTTSSVPSLPTQPRATASRPAGASRRKKDAALIVEATASEPDLSSPAEANRVDPRRPLHQRLRGEPAAPSVGDEGDGEEGKGRRRLGLGAARVALRSDAGAGSFQSY